MYTEGVPGMEHPLNALTTSRGSCKVLETNVCAQPRTYYLQDMYSMIVMSAHRRISATSPSLFLHVSVELKPALVCRRPICKRCVLTRLPDLDDMLVRAQDAFHYLKASFEYVAELTVD